MSIFLRIPRRFRALNAFYIMYLREADSMFINLAQYSKTYHKQIAQI